MSEKSENELWLAEKFTGAYNRQHGTDFVVDPPASEQDSADAFLVSKTCRGRIALQISMATTTARMREEAVQKDIQGAIAAGLLRSGIRDTHVTVTARRPPTKMDARAWQEGILRLVVQNYPNNEKVVTLSDHDIDPRKDHWESPFGDLPFSRLTVRRNFFKEGHKQHCWMDLIILKEVLEVQSTLQDTIQMKLRKNYADSAALWLLLHPGDGAHTVEKIELMATNLHGLEKFAQVWWVYAHRSSDTEIHRLRGREA